MRISNRLTDRLLRRWTYHERLLYTIQAGQNEMARIGLETNRRVKCFGNDVVCCAGSVCIGTIYANRWCRVNTIAAANQIFSTSA